MRQVQDFNNSLQNGLAIGGVVGGGLSRRRQRKQQAEGQNRLAAIAGEGDHEATANEALKQGKVDIAKQYLEMHTRAKGEQRQASEAFLGYMSSALANGATEDQLPIIAAQAAKTVGSQYGLDPEVVRSGAVIGSDYETLSMILKEASEEYTLSQGSRRYRGDEMIAENPKEAMGPGATDITLPDGTRIRRGGNVKDFQARPTLLAPGLSEATSALTQIFDGQTNPLNEPRNVAAAGLQNLPGGQAAGRAMGGESFQRADQPRKLAEAALLPILSGAAITETERPMFQNAFIPQVGDTPAVAHVKALTLQEMSSRADMLQAEGAPLSEGQYANLLNSGYVQLQRRLAREDVMAESTTTDANTRMRANIPQEAVDALLNGVGSDEQFDAVFGEGAAAKVRQTSGR